ncbi:sulfurtransferase TusA family protein [Cellulosimicrobium sp. PMB13]|uniref:sulfurtransferase TusA family protein n=1 Tax=Cellulosimicrobium sp. PMB13 TaxID=3120158 RepID=UPI003F4C3DB0
MSPDDATDAVAGGAREPVVVDARGLRCPVPVIRLAAAARERGTGDLLTVWSTDPAARLDVPAWARMRGHRVVDEHEVAEGHEVAQERDVPQEREPAAAPSVWAITVELGR